MTRVVQNLVIGQGLAGSAVAWTLYWAGQSVLIVDKGDQATASRVSGGLITPMTGKKLVKSPDFEEYWNHAKAFYQRIEAQTSESLFTEGPMLRLFKDEEARSAFKARSAEDSLATVEDWDGKLQSAGEQQWGITMSPAARLDVANYLRVTRQHFEQQDVFIQGEVTEYQRSDDTEKRFVYEVDGIPVLANRVIHCTGAFDSKLFADVPDNPSRGDILEVSISGYQRQEVVHRSIWIAPEEAGRQLVGSTYDWNNRSPEPTEDGKQRLLSQLSNMIEGPVEVHGQMAAVRPTMKDYEPVIGRHPTDADVYLLNGLGSKGALRSPLLAQRLLQTMEGKSDIPAKQDYSRMQAKTEPPQRPLTVLAQEAIGEVLKAEDTAVDATVGNGFDTCFLAIKVGPNGSVIGFDLQSTAIAATTKRLEAKSLSNVTLHNTGHERLSEFSTDGTIAAVMFNLGYLPRSDRNIVTHAATSHRAVSAAITALKPGGLMTVVAYRGHEGGPEEYEAVKQLLDSESAHGQLKIIDSRAAGPETPVLLIFKKSV